MADRNSLIEQYRQKPDETLLGIAVFQRSQYTPEAIEAAELCLRERGIDPDLARGDVNELHQQVRQLKDEAAQRSRDSQQAHQARIAAAGRDVGRCLLTGATVETEVTLYLRSVTSIHHQTESTVRRFKLLAIPIPLSAAAARANRPLRLLGWVGPVGSLVLFFALAFAPLIFLVATEALDLDKTMSIVVLAGAFLTVAGAFLVDAVLQERSLDRLFRAHPLHDTLRRQGFRAVPANLKGVPVVKLYSRILEDWTSNERATAERELIKLGGSEVVTAMLDRLDHRHAAVPALRVLGALRALEAIPEIERVAESGREKAKQTAKDVLQNLIGS